MKFLTDLHSGLKLTKYWSKIGQIFSSAANVKLVCVRSVICYCKKNNLYANKKVIFDHFIFVLVFIIKRNFFFSLGGGVGHVSEHKMIKNHLFKKVTKSVSKEESNC